MIRRSMLSIIGIAILINTLFPFRSTSAPLNYQRRASALTSSQGVPTRAQLTLSSDEVRPVPPRIPESETCALSRYNFQQASGLFAIVTGKLSDLRVQWEAYHGIEQRSSYTYIFVF